MPYYAVKNGRTPGVYNSWSECEQQVKHYPGASFKKFSGEQQARGFAGMPESASASSSRGGGGRASSSYAPVDVWTDGACSNNGRSNPSAGVGVWFGPKNSENVSERLVGKQTNNWAEITAAKRAVEIAARNDVKDLRVNTDSKFVIDCTTKWMPNWKKNNWTLSDGRSEVKVKEPLEALDKVLNDNPDMKVSWRHVPGHAGDPNNEAADRLAVEGSRKPYPRNYGGYDYGYGYGEVNDY